MRKVLAIIVAELLALIVVVGVGGFVAVGCSTNSIGDDPERTLTLPNDTNGSRLVRRCVRLDDCRSPDKGDLVQPGESFVFDIYADEERAYVVSSAEGTTDGVSPTPESLSDLTSCPPGTPEAS